MEAGKFFSVKIFVEKTEVCAAGSADNFTARRQRRVLKRWPLPDAFDAHNYRLYTILMGTLEENHCAAGRQLPVFLSSLNTHRRRTGCPAPKQATIPIGLPLATLPNGNGINSL
jgi:hypothetical protein